ncbi:c-type cytochrome [Synechococcus sp. MIT S9452]|uniref:c-type cytochrome n=1 Tax=Synechococcus sp. MIT S9452 TaxID=3082546 RepID=UPI0039A6B78C
MLGEVWPRRHPLTGSELLDEAPRKRGLITALVVLAVVALVAMSALVASANSRDPYVNSSLEKVGDQEHGSKLFLINCAGCHGIAAQGVVGPNLHGVSQRKNDPALIQQVISGKTPPMPSFQPDPQSMADLLAYLHELQ